MKTFNGIQQHEVSTSGHGIGTRAYLDVDRACVEWETRNGLRDADGYLKNIHGQTAKRRWSHLHFDRKAKP